MKPILSQKIDLFLLHACTYSPPPPPSSGWVAARQISWRKERDSHLMHILLLSSHTHTLRSATLHIHTPASRILILSIPNLPHLQPYRPFYPHSSAHYAACIVSHTWECMAPERVLAHALRSRALLTRSPLFQPLVRSTPFAGLRVHPAPHSLAHAPHPQRRCIVKKPCCVMCVSMIVAILPIVIILCAGMTFQFDMGTTAFEVRSLLNWHFRTSHQAPLRCECPMS